jgi:hypothetical protein
MEFCTPSIILTVVLGTVFLVGLLKRNFYNAMITFFFGLFSILIVTMACNRGSEVAGWIALAAIVGFLIFPILLIYEMLSFTLQFRLIGLSMHQFSPFLNVDGFQYTN